MLSALLAAFLSAQSSDTATTLHLRARGGYREANPLLTNHTAGIVLTKAAIATTGAVAAWRWRQTHPKAARLILTAGAASAGAATAWNVHVARR